MITKRSAEVMSVHTVAFHAIAILIRKEYVLQLQWRCIGVAMAIISKQFLLAFAMAF